MNRQQAARSVTPHSDASRTLSTVSSDELSCETCHRSSDDPPSASTAAPVNNGTGRTIAPGRTVARSTSSADLGGVVDAVCAGNEETRLVPLELYVQGNSQTVFLLFMQHGALSQLDVVKDLVRTNILFIDICDGRK